MRPTGIPQPTLSVTLALDMAVTLPNSSKSRVAQTVEIALCLEWVGGAETVAGRATRKSGSLRAFGTPAIGL